MQHLPPSSSPVPRSFSSSSTQFPRSISVNSSSSQVRDYAAPPVYSSSNLPIEFLSLWEAYSLSSSLYSSFHFHSSLSAISYYLFVPWLFSPCIFPRLVNLSILKQHYTAIWNYSFIVSSINSSPSAPEIIGLLLNDPSQFLLLSEIALHWVVNASLNTPKLFIPRYSIRLINVPLTQPQDFLSRHDQLVSLRAFVLKSSKIRLLTASDSEASTREIQSITTNQLTRDIFVKRISESDDLCELTLTTPLLVTLTGSLVYECEAGNFISLVGIAKTKKEQETQEILHIKLYAIHVLNLNQMGAESVSIIERVFNNSDSVHLFSFLYNEIYNKEDTLGVLVQSISPEVAGQEMIKAAILLAMVGGNEANYSLKLAEIRSNIHILLLGESKTDLSITKALLSSAVWAPRHVLLDFETLPESLQALGMTYENNKKTMTAGPLCEADQALLVVPDLDSIKPWHRWNIQTAQEQQCVHWRRRRVPARIALLASAKPKDDKLDSGASVSQNLFKRLTPAQIDSFDLVFRIAEQRSLSIDLKTARSVIESFQTSAKVKSAPGASRPINNNQTPSLSLRTSNSGMRMTPSPLQSPSPRSSTPIGSPASDSAHSHSVHSQGNTVNNRARASKIGKLRTRLESCASSISLVTKPALRLYLSYCRRYVHPRLDPAAHKEIQKFIQQVENASTTNPHKFPSNRAAGAAELATLIRMTEARAKLEWRNIAMAEDAIEAIEIFKEGHSDLFPDSLQTIDFRKTTQQLVKSKPKRIAAIKAALESRLAQEVNNCFSQQQIMELCELCKFGMQEGEVRDFIAELNGLGILIKRGENYEFVTT
jgi:DNA replicative helicase MCM subunit Mcm2 (Cdc46/Mcm family)